MSEFDNIRFTSGFDVPVDREYGGRPSFLRGVADAYNPGLFKVVFSVQDRRTRSLTVFDTLYLDNVQADDDEPGFSEEDFAKILLARIYDHNQEVGVETRYVMKASYRGRGKGSKTIYESLLVDNEDDGPNFPARAPIEFIDADEAAPGTMFMQHMGMMLSEMRAFQSEMRLDVQASRQHANTVIDKMIDVVSNQVQHAHNQAHAAQAGWDALHTGIDMTKKHHAEVAELRATLQAQSFQLEMLKQSNKKDQRNQLMAGVLPAGLLAAGKTLTDKGSALGPLLTGLAAMTARGGPDGAPPAEDEESSEPQPPKNGAAPRTVDATIIDEIDVSLEDLCTTDEIANAPLVCVARTLGHSLGPSQKQSLHQMLTAEEWKLLNAALSSNDVASISQSMMGFFISFQGRDSDNSLVKKLTMRLSLFQRNLVKEISEYVTGAGKPLDVANMKTSAWKKPKTAPTPPTPPTPPPPTPTPQPTSAQTQPDAPAPAAPSKELDEIKSTLEAATAALVEGRKIQEAQARKITELEQKLTEPKPPTRKKTPKKTTKNDRKDR